MSRKRSVPVRPALVGIAVAFTLALALALAAADAGAASPSQGAPVPAEALSPQVPAEVPCSALVQDGFSSNSTVPDFEEIPGAPTRISSATVVPAANGAPEYCNVKGYVLDQIKFELKLPTTSWQGRYLQLGCGSFCGTITPPESTFGSTFPSCDASLGGDFAIASTDDGHEAAGTDALWAGNDENLRIDFGYRAVHVVALASKAIISAYYSQPAVKAYFVGCSDGGREGLMEAQRYPTDFDGIVAGAPANLMSTDPLWLGYITQINTDSSGEPVLTAEKLPALHEAVLAACDRNDGVVGDGLIGDPRDCNVDPASIECHGADGQSCLTAAQVTVVDDIYRGVVDSHGNRLDPRMVPPGSELSWAGWWIPLAPPSSAPAGTGPTWIAQTFGESAARWLSFPIGRGKPLGQVQINAHEFSQVIQTAKYYEALNPNLRAFRAHGGRLMIYQGGADTLVTPSQTLMYWDAVQRAMGGRQGTSQFARMFLIPGMGHCGAFGPKPEAAALLEQMVDWVEKGEAPESIAVKDQDPTGNQRERPVFPYPLVQKYVGPDPSTDPTGPDRPQNFVAAPPSHIHHDQINWLGNFLLRPQPWASSGKDWRAGGRGGNRRARP